MDTVNLLIIIWTVAVKRIKLLAFVAISKT